MIESDIRIARKSFLTTQLQQLTLVLTERPQSSEDAFSGMNTIIEERETVQIGAYKYTCLPKIFELTNTMQRLFAAAHNARSHANKARKDVRDAKGDAREYAIEAPFLRLDHVIIRPFEFPATGTTGYRAAFPNVSRLTVHITLGPHAIHVFSANMRQLTQQMPRVRSLTLLVESGSIFQKRYMQFRWNGVWPYLESLILDLRGHYRSNLGGDVWQISDIRGETHFRFMEGHFAEELCMLTNRRRSRRRAGKILPKLPYCWAVFPPKSTFDWSVLGSSSNLETLSDAEHIAYRTYDRTARIRIEHRYDPEVDQA